MELNLKIEELLKHFQSITLEEMDAVKLMNRMDTKYFFHSSLLTDILERAKEYYRVLEVSGLRNCQYYTTYFDTPGMNLYNEHLNGKLNRYKVRQRRYDATGDEFFEVKFKTNKNRTLKSRIANTLHADILNEQTDKFLRKKTPYQNTNLQQVIKNDFIRITLVNHNLTERVTLDYNLSFSNFTTDYSCPQLGIVEIKKENLSKPSPLIKVLRELSIRPEGISKYCLGVATLFSNIKINRLKPKLLKIKNL